MTSQQEQPDNIMIKELAPELWPALETFFGAEECSDCWCMNHRIASTVTLVGESARIALSKGVRERKIHGVLAFDGDRPIGWCAFDKIADLPGLDCGFKVADESRDKVWSIHCLAVLSSYPEHDISDAMVRRAIEVMRRLGATRIDSNPPPTLPSENGFSGSIALFEGHGFRILDRIDGFYTRMTKTLET